MNLKNFSILKMNRLKNVRVAVKINFAASSAAVRQSFLKEAAFIKPITEVIPTKNQHNRNRQPHPQTPTLVVIVHRLPPVKNQRRQQRRLLPNQ
jgi:hypothetical protein